MKTLCIAAVVVLSLTSGCQAASLACEKLLKPVDKGPDIRGSWYLIAISSQECWVSTLVSSVLWASVQVNITSKDTPNIYFAKFSAKIFGHCDNTETKDYLFENNTLSEVNYGVVDDADLLLQSGCPDCIVVKDSDDNILYLLSRRKNVTDAELKEFETQAQCLGWNKAEVTNTDHDLENCVSLDEDEEDILKLSFGLFNRLKNTYAVSIKCLMETLYYQPNSIFEFAMELFD